MVKSKKIEVMEFKGTKGKWNYEYDNSDYEPREWFDILSDNGSVLSRRFGDKNSSTDEIKANALLISKAPDMLDMLIKLTSTMDYRNIDEAKQLIKSATEL